MKLQDHLPDRVTVGGRTYSADFDFRNVLRMMDIMARDDLMPDAREYLALKCVFRRVPRDTGAAMDAVRAIIFPETGRSAGKQKITDFEQDADLIRAAFLQVYRINLYRDRLHWLEFSSLLSCLPEGSRYSEILGIRARPVPAPTKWNAEERKWLLEAKALYALRQPGHRQITLEESLRSVAFSLLTLADQGGGGHNA